MKSVQTLNLHLTLPELQNLIQRLIWLNNHQPEPVGKDHPNPNQRIDVPVDLENDTLKISFWKVENMKQSTLVNEEELDLIDG